MIFLHDSISKSSFEESFEMKFYLEGYVCCELVQRKICVSLFVIALRIALT